MAKEANLLVTHEPTHAGKAKDEIEVFFLDMKEKVEFLKCSIDGIFLLRVSDARKIVQKLNAIGKKKPGKFVVTFHWTPIDKWCTSSMAEMKKEVRKLVPKIKTSEKWKMSINKRNYDKHRDVLIRELTEIVDRNEVDLEKPKKIIVVEILGKKAGISLLNANETVDVPHLQKNR